MGDLQNLGSELGATAKADLANLPPLTPILATAFTSILASPTRTTVLAQALQAAAALLPAGEKLAMDEALALLKWVGSEMVKGVEKL